MTEPQYVLHWHRRKSETHVEMQRTKRWKKTGFFGETGIDVESSTVKNQFFLTYPAIHSVWKNSPRGLSVRS